MKKIVIILGIVVVIGLIAWGIWFFMFSGKSHYNIASGPGASLPAVPSASQRASIPENPAVANDFLGGIQNANQVTLSGTVVASSYALQIWGDANKGGEALLKYASSTGWTLVSLGGGEWTVQALIQEGVPLTAAEQLIANLTNTPPSSAVSSANIPSGDTITLGTAAGSVTMNNFYKNADYIAPDQQTVVFQQSSTYSIVYNVLNSSFTISILSAPLEASRQAAEAAFLNALGISQQDACKLSVYENIPASVSDQYAGKSFPLSFCGNATPIQ